MATEPGGAWFNYVPGTTYYLPDGTPISGADLLNNPALNRSPGGNPYVANLQNLPVPASSLAPGGTPSGAGGGATPWGTAGGLLPGNLSAYPPVIGSPWAPVGGGGNPQPVSGGGDLWADPRGGTWGDAAHMPASPIIMRMSPEDWAGMNPGQPYPTDQQWNDMGARSFNPNAPYGSGYTGPPNPSMPGLGGGYNPGDISVPGFGGNPILSGDDLSSILSGIPGIGGGGVPGLGNSAFGDPGGISGILGKIFGGRGGGGVPDLNSLLQSIIPIAGSFLQYLGSDAAFNKAGNLINTAEQNAAGGVRGATGNANEMLNSLLGTTSANAAPYIGAGAGAAGQLSSDLQPGGALNSTLTADQLLKNDPGYQFRLGQGEGDLQSRLASEGFTGSGEAAKQLSDYQQNFASGEFEKAFQRQQEQQQNLFSRLAGTAGLGLQGGGQALTSAEAFGAPQASNLISSSVYGGNAGVAGAGAQAGALIDVNQQKNALIQNIMTELLGLLRPRSVTSGNQGGSVTI